MHFGFSFVDDLVLGLSAAWFTLLGSYMGTQAQAVSGTRNYRGFSRADRTILSIVAVFLMGILQYTGSTDWGYYPSIFDHIPINPLSLVVFISAIGGVWTFCVRFYGTKNKLDKSIETTPWSNPTKPKNKHGKTKSSAKCV